MKQTAVEWLYGKWSEQGTLYFSDLNQAKAMEKKQIMDAWLTKKPTTFNGWKNEFEQYYNETYSSARTESVKSE